MIKIKINKDKNYIKEVIISGHSLYDDYGKDIVCASVSSIVITSVNLILKIDKTTIKVKQDNGLIHVNVLKNEEIVDKILRNMIDMLEELSKDYEKNVKII